MTFDPERGGVPQEMAEGDRATLESPKAEEKTLDSDGVLDHEGMKKIFDKYKKEVFEKGQAAEVERIFADAEKTRRAVIKEYETINGQLGKIGAKAMRTALKAARALIALTAISSAAAVGAYEGLQQEVDAGNQEAVRRHDQLHNLFAQLEVETAAPSDQSSEHAFVTGMPSRMNKAYGGLGDAETVEDELKRELNNTAAEALHLFARANLRVLENPAGIRGVINDSIDEALPTWVSDTEKPGSGKNISDDLSSKE